MSDPNFSEADILKSACDQGNTDGDGPSDSEVKTGDTDGK
jgi:hypothetical protein